MCSKVSRDKKISILGVGWWLDMAATVSRVAEESGKDCDSFGLDFGIVAAVIAPP